MNNLQRLLRPRTVAVVGASENQTRARTSIAALQGADVDLFLVNPRRMDVFGHRTYADLASVPEPVDAVFALVNADVSIEVTATAARLGVGGVVVNAEGFKGSTPEGSARAAALLTAAQPDLAILGPNCNGYIDVHRGVRLSGAPLLPVLPGPVGLITHSGGLLGAVGAAGFERAVGFSHMISTGNELQLGMADLIDFLVEDGNTKVIALVIEAAREPDSLMRALLRAHDAGKPVVALKLGRSQRGQAVAESHTGAITGDVWAYDAMFEQHGVLVARDIPDLVDKTVCFAQIPNHRWSPARNVAILGTSGGWATIAGDVADEEGVNLPALESLRPIVVALAPDADVMNPLDTSGRFVGDRRVLNVIANAYASSSEVDTLMSLWFLDDAGLEMGAPLIAATQDAAKNSEKPTLVVSIDDGRPGEVARHLPDDGIAIGRGVRSAMRAVAAMGQFVTGRESPLGRNDDCPATPIPRPVDVVDSTAGPMLSFNESMALLVSAGISVAPYIVLTEAFEFGDQLPGFQRFVVKLADIPHRTDIGAVRLNVARANIPATIRELQDLARTLRLPTEVAVQGHLKVSGEAILAISTTSPLGPFVAFGPGGVLVELGARPVGAIAPVSVAQAHHTVGRLGTPSFLEGIRGGSAWDANEIASLVANLSELAVNAGSWLDTLEINPLALVDGRPVALDCLCLTRPKPPVKTPDGQGPLEHAAVPAFTSTAQASQLNPER